jgi:branched-chain amino acid transport system substrate-binding protein
MYQATHLKEVRIRFLLPGITLNASPTDYRPIEQFIMHRFDGNQWEMLGDVMQVSAVN